MTTPMADAVCTLLCIGDGGPLRKVRRCHRPVRPKGTALPPPSSPHPSCQTRSEPQPGILHLNKCTRSESIHGRVHVDSASGDHTLRLDDALKITHTLQSKGARNRLLRVASPVRINHQGLIPITYILDNSLQKRVA